MMRPAEICRLLSIISINDKGTDTTQSGIRAFVCAGHKARSVFIVGAVFDFPYISIACSGEKGCRNWGVFSKKFKDSGSGAVKDVEAWNPGHQEQVSACSTNP